MEVSVHRKLLNNPTYYPCLLLGCGSCHFPTTKTMSYIYTIQTNSELNNRFLIKLHPLTANSSLFYGCMHTMHLCMWIKLIYWFDFVQFARRLNGYECCTVTFPNSPRIKRIWSHCTEGNKRMHWITSRVWFCCITVHRITGAPPSSRRPTIPE